MATRRTLIAAALVLLAAFITACGGSHHKAPPHRPTPNAPEPGHVCTPQNYYMQCAKPKGGFRLQPPTAAQVFAYGVDFGWSCPNGRSLGVAFGASYLSSDGAKNWTRACVNAYHSQGLATVVVWETAANRAASGYSAGVADARQARAQANYLGEPANRPIFFAVDYDTTGGTGAIVPYFQGVRDVLGAAHAGAYGGLATMQAVFGRRLVSYGWQTAAWSFGVWDPRAQMQQYSFGDALDWNRAVARDYGQWPYSPPKPPPPPIPSDFYGRCSRLDAVTYFKAHAGHGHVSSAQHQQAVRIRAWLVKNKIGCTRPGWQLRPPTKTVSRPYRYPQRRGALA